MATCPHSRSNKKAIGWTLSLFLVLSTLAAADDGLCVLSRDLRLTNPLPDKIEQAMLVSRANDNSKYDLTLFRSRPFSAQYGYIGIVLGDRTIAITSAGTGSGQASSYSYNIGASIDDTTLIPQIVKQFNPRVLERHHPGQQMLVSFVPDKEAFKPGEPVTVKLRITNIGTNTFTFMQGGRQRGPRDDQFAFSAEFNAEMLPDIGDPRNWGGIGHAVSLDPGQRHEVSVDLTKWFDFTRPGCYILRGSYYMQFLDPSEMGSDVIWEDFACANFTIKVKE